MAFLCRSAPQAPIGITADVSTLVAQAEQNNPEIESARRRSTLNRFERDVFAPCPEPEKNGEDAYHLVQTVLLELLDPSLSSTENKPNHLQLILGEIEAELDTLMASGLLAASFEDLKHIKKH
ncbi:hypothetical protein [Methylobacter svalbardensis]|uniref:hypothetical protein n=1 Tax=Methylobacter svalbardensis TaxID=3080016 RepID=UPI0030EBA33D